MGGRGVRQGIPGAGIRLPCASGSGGHAAAQLAPAPCGRATSSARPLHAAPHGAQPPQAPTARPALRAPPRRACLPTYTMRAPPCTRRSMSSETKRSYRTTSAVCISCSARSVRSPGSPGPVPTRNTRPGPGAGQGAPDGPAVAAAAWGRARREGGRGCGPLRPRRPGRVPHGARGLMPQGAAAPPHRLCDRAAAPGRPPRRGRRCAPRPACYRRAQCRGHRHPI